MNKVTSNEIDTPQLIYDFYISCIKYSINGEEMKFDLNDDKDSEHDKKDNSKDITLDKSNIENKDISLNTKNYSKEEKYISNGIVRLSITLKVNGDKNKIEKYINSLNHITKRKLNVKSIKLSSKMDITEEEKISEKEIASNSYINDSESLDVNNIHNVKDNEVIDKEENNSILVKDDDISAEIVFYQYIKVNEENYDAIRNYDFYNKKIGFKSIADMFGSKKRSR
ncbi:hypothetical protein [Clostridium tetanomorphum]|uniref:hypothetical protein n=1 Tax=Clostridium tetanomorphum TaxID=1553 RepID=UPI000D8B8E39|nr:hypothetical protein [Clostridium tetanomorphum]SQB89768.1 Uncharacterised protein [Clostridium tetanomorphum]